MALKLTGLVSGMDTYSMIDELTSSQRQRKDNIVKEQKLLEYQQDAWKEINKKVYSFFSKNLSDMRFSSSYNIKSIKVSDSSKANVTGDVSAINGVQTLEIKSLAKTGYLTGGKLNSNIKNLSKLSDLGISSGSLTLKVNGKENTIDLNEDMTINDLVIKLKENGINANFDEANNRFFISSKNSGVENDFSLRANNEEGFDALNKLGLNCISSSDILAYKEFMKTADINSSEYKFAEQIVSKYEKYHKLLEENPSDTNKINVLGRELGLDKSKLGPSRIEGSNASIVLNGASFESNSNNFQINNLSITAKAVTDENEELSISIDNDPEKIYERVVKFFNEYNELIKELEEKYNAPSAGSYKPLTDEEMESLTDKQIEKWEDKVKTSCLRRDDTLSGIISTLKTSMQKTFNINGEELGLYNFGINTQGYFEAADNERGVYHIDGNPDDDITSGKTDKLKAAICNDPEKFTKFFSSLSNELYTNLNDKMKSTSYRSAYTIYDDKRIKKQHEEYNNKIKEWENKINKMTEKYERQFATMETMLAQMQSNMNYMSSFFTGM